MTAPTYITAQLRRPSRDNPSGVVAEGWFCVGDGVVTLTTRDGEPLPGEGNRRTLATNDNPRAVASRMVKSRAGRHAARPFNRPLRYPRVKY